MITDALKAAARAYASKCLDAKGNQRRLSCGSCARECRNLRDKLEKGDAMGIVGAFASGASMALKKNAYDLADKARAKLGKQPMLDLLQSVKAKIDADLPQGSTSRITNVNGVRCVEIKGEPPAFLIDQSGSHILKLDGVRLHYVV